LIKTPADVSKIGTERVTGGAGFIGANFVLDWIAGSDEPVFNLDKLTYAGNLETLASLQGNPRHIFVQGDIGDRALVERLLAEHQPRAVVNFAAESQALCSQIANGLEQRSPVFGRIRGVLDAVVLHFCGGATRPRHHLIDVEPNHLADAYAR
jgi:nucleoside-diphosphate-sugar epimerase